VLKAEVRVRRPGPDGNTIHAALVVGEDHIIECVALDATVENQVDPKTASHYLSVKHRFNYLRSASG
jgi:hypothetical protein